MKTIIIAISIFFVVIVLPVGGAVYLSAHGASQQAVGSEGNVSIVDGKQIIEIHAKGGYQPRVSTARAGVPTVLRFDTNATFDCSSSVRIPSMNISKNLPQTGTTDIDLGTAQAGVLQGTCSMGMYPFEVNFRS